ncbi:stage 0 sporulation protein J [Candidatus Shapirobacteria bacterium CG09_land_8_20_14_0_10_47_13]|uniref:Stage 0 sporulation protein J n=1 Tax=Candidatus Shapirobacteria bacterium CG09_land_8_20_14_0_10_47_13 TaxID=1974481 RepID=A0A2H0WMR9_9BACT|nr:MAG: stage 0 sporulation protein J [Candidatus Shapirobacteria bacterium CG09_land_8_20_14_0_10_47_13]
MSEPQIVDLDIDSLQSNPLQPRGLITTESLSELVESIKEHGILEPLVVAKTPAGYQIIAGERRWRAARIVGLKSVPAIIRETTPQGMLEMAIVENVQREDLNPIERAQAFIRLMKEFGLSNKEIAQRISKSPAYISNSIKLLTLPDALKDGLLSGLITEGHARALAGIDDAKLMVEAYKMVLKESSSVRRAEDIARRIRSKAGQPSKATEGGPPHIISEETDKIMEDIRMTLTTDDSKAIVRLSRSRAETRLVIALKGNLEKTEDRLQKIYKGIAGKTA